VPKRVFGSSNQSEAAGKFSERAFAAELNNSCLRPLLPWHPSAFGEVNPSTAQSVLESRGPITSRPASTSFLITLRRSTYNPGVFNVCSILHTVFGNAGERSSLRATCSSIRRHNRGIEGNGSRSGRGCARFRERRGRNNLAPEAQPSSTTRARIFSNAIWSASLSGRLSFRARATKTHMVGSGFSVSFSPCPGHVAPAILSGAEE
jgi:hypothetical protein